MNHPRFERTRDSVVYTKVPRCSLVCLGRLDKALPLIYDP